MRSVALSAIEAALCKGIQQILSDCDDHIPLSSAIQQLEARCLEHIRLVFSLDWAAMDRSQSVIGANVRVAIWPTSERTPDPLVLALAPAPESPSHLVAVAFLRVVGKI